MAMVVAEKRMPVPIPGTIKMKIQATVLVETRRYLEHAISQDRVQMVETSVH